MMRREHTPSGNRPYETRTERTGNLLLLRIVTLIVAAAMLLSSCPHPFDNIVDPEAENYLGTEIADNDGDGVGQYFDVDEITLVSPADEAELESVTPTLTVYGFDPDTVSAYHIQISTSKEAFADNLVLDKSDYTSNACVVPAGKLIWPVTYYWRAKAYDGENWSSSWSKVRSFTVPAGGPANPVPANDGTTIDTTPTLNWGDVTGAAGYHIQVNTAEDFGGTSIADDNSLTASEYAVSTVLSDNTSYYWRVKVKNADGVWGDWGSTWSFTVDIAPPTTPTPSDGGNTADTTPTLNWDDVTGAAGYHIQVNTAEDFSGITIADDATLTASEYAVTTVLSDNASYYWRVKVKNADGVWGDWSSTWSFKVGFDIGDTGPAGGLVFYDKGSYSDGWCYLEAAPASTEWTSIEWGAYGTDISGAEGTAVGTGEQNTADIVSYLGTGSTYAGQLCDGLEHAGYDDWFLPSKDELNMMYENLHQQSLGGFADGYYWSSSEYTSYDAWYQYFNYGSQYYYTKYLNKRVRAVRAF